MPEDEYTCELEDDILGMEEEDSNVVKENLSCEREIFEFKDGAVMKKRKKTTESHQISQHQFK